MTLNTDSKKLNINKCSDCVNLLCSKNLFGCDYEYFKNVKEQDVLLLIPVLFDCIYFEKLDI